MIITSDWHIHSENSCDGACMPVSDLLREAPERGILDFGLTDHLHSPVNLPDVVASRREFLSHNPPGNVHFGVELSCMSQWELDELASGRHGAPVYGLRQGGPPAGPLALGMTAEDIAEHEVEYVVAGVHWPMYVPFEREAVIRDYHRQNMFLATHPLVTIVAHPWWWMGHWQNEDKSYTTEPWLDDFGVIPTSMHDEFAAAAMEHDSVVEINAQAMLLNPQYPERFKRQYVEYTAELKARGVTLSIGSDCHSAHYQTDFETTAEMLASVGFTDADFWRLPPRPATAEGEA